MRTRDLERVMSKAFERAEEWRVAKGLPARKAPPTHQAPDGRTFVGPRRYKVTLWLNPWEYLDMLEAMRQSGFRGSLRGFLVNTAAESTGKAHLKAPVRRKLRAVG